MGSPFSVGPIESGGGGVSGLSSATGGTALADNVIVRGDGTTGIQGSAVTIADTTGTMTFPNTGEILWSDCGLERIAAGIIQVNNGSTGQANFRAASVDLNSGGAQYAALLSSGTPGLSIAAGGSLYWSSNSNQYNSAKDVGLSRNAAGVLRVTDGSTGIGSLNAARTVAAEVTSPETVASTDSRKVFTNEGAGASVTYNLPAAVAGLEYIFVVQATQNMVVTAAGGDTIRVATEVSSAGGTATNGTIGSVLHIIAINDTEWYGISVQGTWTLA